MGQIKSLEPGTLIHTQQSLVWCEERCKNQTKLIHWEAALWGKGFVDWRGQRRRSKLAECVRKSRHIKPFIFYILSILYWSVKCKVDLWLEITVRSKSRKAVEAILTFKIHVYNLNFIMYWLFLFVLMHGFVLALLFYLVT